MEFTIIQSGTRRRLQTPSGAGCSPARPRTVVGTYDGTTQRLYIDGTQVASAPLTGAISTDSRPADDRRLGRGPGFFKGTIGIPPTIYG